MSRRRQKKEKKPAYILRVARHYGWKPGRAMSEVLEWAEVIVVAAGLAALIIGFVTVRMHVPTDSMYPTINGDRSIFKADSFFVDRITYYFRDPKPGDIVVFRFDVAALTREPIAGSPAEQAGMQANEYVFAEQVPAYLAGRAVYTQTAMNQTIASLPSGSPISLRTAQGNSYSLGQKTSETTLEELGIRLKVKRMRYVKRLIAVGGQTVQIVNGNITVDGETLEGERFDHDYISDDVHFQYGINPTLVPEGYYFMLGDNSGNSFDGRYWGFVPQKDIIGVPYLRVWPLTRFRIL